MEKGREEETLTPIQQANFNIIMIYEDCDAITPWSFSKVSHSCILSSIRHTSISKARASLNKIMKLLWESDIFLTEEQLEELKYHTLRFGRHYMCLAQHSTDAGTLFF